MFDGRCIRRVLKTISVRYSDIDVGLIFQRHWDFLCLTDVVYVVCCRRFQVDTWISMWAYISKALGFSLFDGRCIRRVLKTITVRYLDIDVGLIFQRHWDFLIDC